MNTHSDDLLPGAAAPPAAPLPGANQQGSRPSSHIWNASANSLATVGAPTGPFQQRARAGTLPSRLSPGLHFNAAAAGSSASLGSLALLSPQERERESALGSSPMRSPFAYATAGSGSPGPSSGLPIGAANGGLGSLGSLGHHQSHQSLSSLPVNPLPAALQSDLLGPPPSSRLRSGSLNLTNERRLTSFGNSIWSNSPRASADTTPGAGPGTPKRLSQAIDDGPPVDDKMQPFLNGLAMRPDPARLRSYTLTTVPQGPPQHPQQRPAHQVPVHLPDMPSFEDRLFQRSPYRPRAQTTSAAFEPQPLPPSASPTHEETPTRSLWIGNVPPSTSSYALQAMFAPYGAIESARVLANKSCGFVNFASIESAVRARTVINAQELFPGFGPSRVRFAKLAEAERSDDSAPSSSSASLPIGAADHHQQQPQHAQHHVSPPARQLSLEVPKPRALEECVSSILATVEDLGAHAAGMSYAQQLCERAVAFTGYCNEIDPPPEGKADRHYDSPTLREVRKSLDTSAGDAERVAKDMLRTKELPELASDYVGNTVVQKLFDLTSEPTKDDMIDAIAPVLAQIGVHKNGTWAAQKIIDVAGTDHQRAVIAKALQPYCVPLFLDQFGNYVMQGCLKFGAPANDFIFESLLDRFLDIAQGRFGARALRACLESHNITADQSRLMAAAIIEYAVQLAVNTNGALLLTWLLDTCTLPNRHTLLASKLIPALVPLCIHKLASLTILKIASNHSEPVARDIIIAHIFEPEVLGQILKDHNNGATFIYKLLGSLELIQRNAAIARVRAAVHAAPVSSQAPALKKLLEELGQQPGGPQRSSPILQQQHDSSPLFASSHNNGSYYPNSQQHSDMSILRDPFGSSVTPLADQFDNFHLNNQYRSQGAPQDYFTL